MTEIAIIINSVIAIGFVFVIIPIYMGVLTYQVHWAAKRATIMDVLFNKFKEMATCGKVPVKQIVKCAEDINELTNSDENKAVVKKAEILVSRIDGQIKYYTENDIEKEIEVK